MSKTFTAIALVLALASAPAYAKPNHCAIVGKIFSAVAKSQSGGAQKATLEALSAQITDPATKKAFADAIQQSYDHKFDGVPAGSLGTLQAAICNANNQ